MVKWFVASDGALGRARLIVELLVGSRYGVNVRVVDKSIDESLDLRHVLFRLCNIRIANDRSTSVCTAPHDVSSPVM